MCIRDSFADHPALFGFDMLNEPFLGSDGGKLFKKLISTAVGTVIGDKRVKCFKLVGDFLNKQRRDEVKYLEQITGDVLKDVTRKAGYEYVRKFDIEKYSPFINKVSTAIREVTDKGILCLLYTSRRGEIIKSPDALHGHYVILVTLAYGLIEAVVDGDGDEVVLLKI